jgi:hypothetical protein
MAGRRNRIALIILVGVLLVYVGSYLSFRFTHTGVWDVDGNAYVIFPKGMGPLYYSFRPITYVDVLLTGMRFHIGPHDRR